MCGATHNGRSTRIREYLKANPKSRSIEVARALADDPGEVNRELRRMTELGMVRREENGGYGKQLHSLITATLPTRKRPLAMRIKMESAPSKRAPASIAAPSTDEWIARGGKVQRLPCNFDNITAHSRPALSIQKEGRARHG